jgi:hypothetical protein
MQDGPASVVGVDSSTEYIDRRPAAAMVCYQKRRRGKALSRSGSSVLECPFGHSKLTAVPILSLASDAILQRTTPTLDCSSSRAEVVMQVRQGASVVRCSCAASVADTSATLLVMVSSSAAGRPRVTRIT